MKFRINKDKCTGCGVCVQITKGGTRLNQDMKAEVIDDEKIEEAGGEEVCPFGAIEKIEDN
jgi:ferredoxin